MSDAVLVLIVLAVGTFALKAAGPLALGGRHLPASAQRVVDLLPAALLAALALVSTVGDGRSISIDPRLVGLVAAAVALWKRAPFVMVIVIASASTAIFRAIS